MADKYRSICFTLNNYTEEDVTRIRACATEITYVVFQRERGREGGTPHLQGYMHHANPKSLGGWKRIVGDRAHIERARGTGVQNREYCTKEETREPGTEPFEAGTMPSQGSRSDLDAVHRRIVEGATTREIAAEHPGDFIRYHRGITALQQLYVAPRRHQTRVYWYYGPTGTGKSREANERFPNAYWKMGANKWWDGYHSHAEIIIDDYRCDMCTFAEMLRLFDRYPHRVETKGGTVEFVPTDIIVTTPKGPRETWQSRTEEDLQQLMRRLTEVRYFPAMFAPVLGDNPAVVQGSAGGSPASSQSVSIRDRAHAGPIGGFDEPWPDDGSDLNWPNVDYVLCDEEDVIEQT